jgi:hypothetical protein
MLLVVLTGAEFGVSHKIGVYDKGVMQLYSRKLLLFRSVAYS